LGRAFNGNDEEGQGFYDLCITVNPNNENEVFVGGVNTWKTLDGGDTWELVTFTRNTPSNTPIIHADHHFLTLSPNAKNMYLSHDGGIHRTTDNGKSWTDITSGLAITQIYRFSVARTDPSVMIFGAQDNSTNVLRNGQWFKAFGGDGMDCQIDYTDETRMYGSSQYGSFRRTFDGGNNWSNIKPSSEGQNEGAWITPFVIHPTRNNQVFTGFRRMYRSTDGGSAWTPISENIFNGNIRFIAVAPSRPRTIYAATLNQLWYTNELGDDWTRVNLPKGSPITRIIVSPNDEKVIWATFSSYSDGNNVYRSDDQGTTWTNISGSLPSLPVTTIMYQPGTDDGLYIGTEIGVYYRDNNLSDWEFYSNGLPNVIVTDLDLNIDAGRLYAGTMGRGIWTAPLYSASAPTANFVSTNELLCAGDETSFFNWSLGSAEGFEWSFPGGDPATSTDREPTVTYNQAGNYDVQLIVTNGLGSDTLNLSEHIRVADAPQPVVTLVSGGDIISEGDIRFCDGNTVIMDAGTDGSSYQWNDDNDATTRQVEIVKNIFNLRVDVGNDNGCEGRSESVRIRTYSPAINDLVITQEYDSLVATEDDEDFVYEWYRNGEQIEGADKPTFKLIETGQYRLIVRDTANNCSKESNLRDIVSSVDDGNWAASPLEVLPNPNNGEFTLEMEFEKIIGNITLEITDMQGKSVTIFENIPLNSNTLSKPISLKALAAGRYIAKVVSDDGAWTQQFVIK
jgi:PKD repeat protein